MTVTRANGKAVSAPENADAALVMGAPMQLAGPSERLHWLAAMLYIIGI